MQRIVGFGGPKVSDAGSGCRGEQKGVARCRSLRRFGVQKVSRVGLRCTGEQKEWGVIGGGRLLLNRDTSH